MVQSLAMAVVAKDAMEAVGERLTTELFQDPKAFKKFLVDNAYNIDQWLLQRQPKNAIDAGSTAAMGFYDAESNTFYTMNVGDSRIIFFEATDDPDKKGKRKPKKIMSSLGKRIQSPDPPVNGPNLF